MTKIVEIEDRGATVAWSPVTSHADYLALGVKDSGSIGFDDYGGDLELYDLNVSTNDGSSPKPQLVGGIKTTARFSSIGWTTPVGSHGMGLVGGGMVDGVVNIWDPRALINKSESALITSFKKHDGGAVTALQFNGISPEMLATGGSDGQLLITSLEKPDAPSSSLPGTEPSLGPEISCISWNTQVAHIVASSGSDGFVSVWDLKGKKPWCKFGAGGMAVSDMAWNPNQGLHLVTASIDDRNPMLKLWDLRASTSMPLATLSGHTQGVLSLAWCPHDDTLLLSCGKDNRTILWDLYSLSPIAELPNDDPSDHITDPAAANSASDIYGAGGLSTSQQRRYDVQWSPLKRGVISTCSFDRKVQTHSVIGLATKCGRPPKWLKPSSGVSCGFGGSVVSFSANDKVVKLATFVEQPELVKASTKFEQDISSTDVLAFCRHMIETAKDPSEAQAWSFMQVMFEANAREQLLEHLGFRAEEIAKAAQEFSGKNSALGDGQKIGLPAAAETAVKKALLVGNFEAAVECCFRVGNMADGLILASCGGAELWAKTQERYFASESPKRPFLSIVSAVIHNQLDSLVANSNTSAWQETLAIISTYGKSDEFPGLCIALGNRLDEAGDYKNASLCYMCSLSLDLTAKYWKKQLEASNKALGSTDYLALHDFVVKVEVFLKALDPSTVLNPELSDLFYEYARALSDQGLLVTASRYSRGDSIGSKILRDRLYRSRESPSCLAMMGAAPEFPFSLDTTNHAASTVSTTAASVAKQSYPQQQRQQHQHQNASTTNAYATGEQHATVNSTHQAAQYSQQPSAQPQASSADQLPSGWVALTDPSSGLTYYANQATGESTWEKPEAPQVSAAPAAVAPQASQPVQEQAPQASQPSQPDKVNHANSTPLTLAAKYGDGFVSSASHPELAEQYGNVGTSNPYTGAHRPGTATVSVVEKPPVSGTFDPSAAPELPPEMSPIKEGLLELSSALSELNLTASDKKQLSEGEKGIAVLLKRLARGDIDQEVVGKVGSMVEALRNRDYLAAASIQNKLVNSNWRDHKDWLKGVKFLIQLTTKKLVHYS